MTHVMSNKLICVFGLGQSGVSAARYLEKTQQSFFVIDTRENPPGKHELETMTYCQQAYFGEFSQRDLNHAAMIIVSPGISPKISALASARQAGVKVIGDIELFVKNTDKKIVAITGSNGKSTVTDLTHRLLVAAGMNAKIGGNYGIPALDYLPDDSADIYVLELSSFQLDTAPSLRADVGAILNISEDHMDRYENFEEYRQSKLSLVNNAKVIIANADDKAIDVKSDSPVILFSSKIKSENVTPYAVSYKHNQYMLTANEQPLVMVDDLQLSGNHNWSNVLACLAILEALNVKPNQAVMKALKDYQGLPHRFQLVSRKDNIDWVNDSKATNVGATQAAINSTDHKVYSCIILIAGGDAKGSDLQPLKASLSKVSYVILMGKDAKQFEKLIEAKKVCFVETMQAAVHQAKAYIDTYKQMSTSNESDKVMVLLSPACSSLDMYKNFEARGQSFIDAVKECA